MASWWLYVSNDGDDDDDDDWVDDVSDDWDYGDGGEDACCHDYNDDSDDTDRKNYNCKDYAIKTVIVIISKMTVLPMIMTVKIVMIYTNDTDDLQ